MKYVGFLMILIAATVFSDGYSRHMKKRLSECEGFLAFITHARLQMSCYLKPLSELSDGFYSKPLSESGFPDYLKNGTGICEAYKMARCRLSLAKEEDLLLENLFSSLGGGYLDDELKLLDVYHSRLEEIFLNLKREVPRNSRLVSTLSVTAAVGFLILVI